MTAPTDPERSAGPARAAESGNRGPLQGIKVVELASELAAYAGKLLGDMGADVVLVEPPGGHRARTYGPFLDDVPDPEGSLWWWHYQTSKRGVVLDLDDADGQQALRDLVARADVVLEAEHPGRLAALGLDHDQLRAERPELVWVSVTPFGRGTSRSLEPATDLTLLTGGGSAWSCGYDDHSLPPVRGGGNQGYQTASVFAVLSTLTALLHKDISGTGQFIDVSAHAATNISTEMGSVWWLVSGEAVQRQTGRHAMVMQTMEVQVLAGDGQYVTTGFAPHSEADYRNLLEWMDTLGIRDEYPEAFFLERGVERGGIDPRNLAPDDVEGVAIFGGGRDALVFIAQHISAYDFFLGAQQRDMQCGIIYAPDEALADPHFVERGFPVQVRHDALDRSFTYPGPPLRMQGSPLQISRPAPRLGQHDDEVLGDLGS